MAGLEKIEAKILADARAKADELIKNAEKEAHEIIEKAQAEADEQSEKRMAQAGLEGEKTHLRAVSAAKMEAKKRLLSAKQEILDESFRRAREQILNMPFGDYEELLIEWIISAADTGAEKLILSKGDSEKISLLRFVARINAKLTDQGGKAGITIAEETIDAPAGFLLRRGDIVVNCTLDAMLAAKREELEVELAKILF